MTKILKFDSEGIKWHQNHNDSCVYIQKTNIPQFSIMNNKLMRNWSTVPNHFLDHKKAVLHPDHNTNYWSQKNKISDLLSQTHGKNQQRKSYPLHKRRYANRAFKCRANNNNKYRKNQWKHPKIDFSYRKKSLKDLRKITALNILNNNGFIYNPEMINILRPNAPRNTTRFLAKVFTNNKIMNQAKPKKKSFSWGKQWYSVKNEQSELDQNILSLWPRTPVISLVEKLSFKSEISTISSELNEENWDQIDGTMEGLIDSTFFDFDEKLNSLAKSEILKTSAISSDSSLC